MKQTVIKRFCDCSLFMVSDISGSYFGTRNFVLLCWCLHKAFLMSGTGSTFSL